MQLYFFTFSSCGEKLGVCEILAPVLGGFCSYVKVLHVNHSKKEITRVSSLAFIISVTSVNCQTSLYCNNIFDMYVAASPKNTTLIRIFKTMLNKCNELNTFSLVLLFTLIFSN